MARTESVPCQSPEEEGCGYTQLSELCGVSCDESSRINLSYGVKSKIIFFLLVSQVEHQKLHSVKAMELSNEGLNNILSSVCLS